MHFGVKADGRLWAPSRDGASRLRTALARWFTRLVVILALRARLRRLRKRPAFPVGKGWLSWL